MKASQLLDPQDSFIPRHLGSDREQMQKMLDHLGVSSVSALIEDAVPAAIRMNRSLEVVGPAGEQAALAELEALAAKNTVFTSLIGMGYHDTTVPPVIQRNVLENPGWYTQYTPYQAEIAQGRMEALVNFQTMVADLTGLPMANASLLDEGTAAAEAMSLCHAIGRGKKNGFFIIDGVHPQTIDVMRTRAEPLGFELHSGTAAQIDFDSQDLFGILIQYPATDGSIEDHRELINRAHDAGALVVMATDLMALTLLTPPGELGADVAIGSAQRFGVPLGAGGPHAAFMATREQHKRHLPGRIIGVSQDAMGRPAYRLALQTREQHIRRDKATSNICTAQVLLAIMASMYGVYHGPRGIERIARRVHGLTKVLASGLKRLGFDVGDGVFFDTLRVRLSAGRADPLLAAARAASINLRAYANGDVGIALDERSGPQLIDTLFEVFNGGARPDFSAAALAEDVSTDMVEGFRRQSAYMTHPVFNRYHCEHEMLRYMHRLQGRDLSLTHAMIPLGSCTMKLNATSQMVPVTWPAFGRIHPFAPWDQQQGYVEMFRQLEGWLKEITGFAAVSLQPNAGSQGEYSGLLTIRAYQADRGQGHRNVCLIPTSAHGTNPASAVMAGMKVVPVKCDQQGNIDLDDLKAKAEKHTDSLAALMITYPSTHGVFEVTIKEVNAIVHAHGGQVYLDGANMNAQVGLTRPGDYGADVCHLNLHKTFCIPHGGGGPGMGPIGVAEHLAPFLPGHAHMDRPAKKAIGPVASAPYGSPSILPISWMYIRMMGAEGLTDATRLAILNANYMAKRLEGHYDILYTGNNGRVAHEFILDTRPFKKSAGVEVDDIAKRLMDFGFHAPTMSWPVPGTMMVEPTESESIEELDRFCDAMIAIREEIRAIETGGLDLAENPLKHAPHTAEDVCSEKWDRPYSRQQAAFPLPWVKAAKFWPAVGRVDNAYGDRHLVCTCPPMDSYE